MTDDVIKDLEAAVRTKETLHETFIMNIEDRLKQQRDRIKNLEAALRNIAKGDIPRTVKAQFRDDGEPSKHDRCEHGVWMYEECGCCVEDYAREILEPQPTMQAPVERKDLSALNPEPLRALSSEEIKGMKNE